MDGLYDLLAGAVVATFIIGLNWYVVYVERPRSMGRIHLHSTDRTESSPRKARSDEAEGAAELSLLRTEARLQR